MKNTIRQSAIIIISLLSTSPLYAQSDANIVSEVKDAAQAIYQQLLENPNMSEQEQEALMMQMMSQSKMGQAMFQNRKRDMPNILIVMKGARVCLSKADTTDQANACADQANEKSRSLGIEEDDDEDGERFSHWDKAEKTQTLAELDEGIQELERGLPCIEKAQSFADMASCGLGDE